MSKTNDWQRVCLKDVCESIIDCVNKTAPTVDYPTPYKMIRTTNVKAGWINLSDVKYVTEDIFRTWTRRAVPQKGDVILTREAPLGEVGMLRGDDTVFLGQRLVQYRADSSKLDNRFLLYCFQADDLQGQIKALGSGSTVEHMRVPDAEKLTLLLPSLPVQKKIADILSAYDDLIENNTRRIKILEEMARSLYDEWFVKFRFSGHEQTKLVDSELGLIPEGWIIKNIDAITDEIIDYRGKTPNKLGGDWSEQGIMAISAKNIKQGRLINLDKAKFVDEALYKKWMKSELKQGDILLTSEAPLGELYYLVENKKFCLSQRVFAIRANSQIICPSILYFSLSSPLGQRELMMRQSGTTVLGIRQQELRKVRLILPPIEFQANIAQVLDNFLKHIETLHQKNENLCQTRDLLLPKLISGEIDVEKLEVTEEEGAISNGGKVIDIREEVLTG